MDREQTDDKRGDISRLEIMRDLSTFVLVWMLFAALGCRSSEDQNYARNLKFFEDRKSDRKADGSEHPNPANVAYRHLSQITVRDLQQPIIYHAYVDPVELGNLRGKEQGTAELGVWWSESGFVQYDLTISIGGTEAAILSSSFDSESEKHSTRKKDFEFVVHYAMFNIDRELLAEIDSAKTAGILFALKTNKGERLSDWFPWRDVTTF
jgi:hypothetical protein